MYKQHAFTNVSVSSRFPENGSGGEIFGSLNLKGDGLVGGGDGDECRDGGGGGVGAGGGGSGS